MTSTKWSTFLRLDLKDRDIKGLVDTGTISRSNEMWVNDTYLAALTHGVQIGTGWTSPMVQLAVKRRDKKPIHDWRDMQRIKNELVGAENEGMEIYPAESRLLDSSNVYFMFVFEDPKVRWPFGFATRWVNNVSENGSVQRPFPLDSMPKDCMTTKEFLAWRSEAEVDRVARQHDADVEQAQQGAKEVAK